MRKPRGYWDYEHCYEEAKRYSCRSEFKRENFKAYHIANINDWLGDYDWFTRPNKKWNYQNCLEESKKYTSRSEFAQNSSGAYHVASRNGWLKDYTWLPEDGRSLKLEQYGIWTKEACFKEAQKYKTRTEFARKNNSAYNSAR